MIYTVTMNPSVDYIMHVRNFSAGTIMRSECVSYHCGGKGINVSAILNELGFPSRALGFTAGIVGRVIEDRLSAKGISSDFVHLESGESRINVKIRSELETDINASGPDISEKDVDKLLQKLRQAVSGDIIVLSGSVPKCLGDNIYSDIMRELYDRNVRFVVDAQDKLLYNSIRYRPFLIKPNNEELSQIFGRYAETDEQIVSQAEELQRLGAENVLVSRGSRGALLLTHGGEVYTAKAAVGKAVNTVGAGDSMVAGFIAGYLSSGSFETALRTGSAAGGATAFSEGLADRENILKLFSIIDCDKIKG